MTKPYPVLTYYDNTGLVNVLIGSKEYTYDIDAAQIPALVRTWQYAPWRTLAKLKTLDRLAKSA